MFNKHIGLLVAIFAGLSGLVLSACAIPAAAIGQPVVEQPTQSPEAVVEEFYTWAIGYAGFNPETQERHNPMVDGSYRARPELGPAMIEHYDAIIASFEGPGGGYDPFLCAQDVPTSITVHPAEYDDAGNAQVKVETSFVGHSFLVDLSLVENEWKFSNVICSVN